MSKLYLLQSGFVTTNADFLVKDDIRELSARDRLFFKDTRITTTDSFYDERVEKLFQTFHKDNANLKNFEFREEILKTAIRVFSHQGMSLIPWIRTQLSQRTVGYLHRQYLLETLSVAGTTARRNLDNYTYFRLLSPVGNNDNFNTGKIDIEEELNKKIRAFSDLSLPAMLTTWTRDMDGFTDLLKTLHVVFGRRKETFTTPSRVI